SIARTLASQFGSVEDPEFLRNSYLYAHELPRRIRAFLNDFDCQEPAPGICLISGYPIDDANIGDTPVHWKWRPKQSPVLAEEFLLVLLGSLVGRAIGWATQQDGHIIHEVFPIKEHAQEQLGTGSEKLLWWHNEDAFHAYRGDYLV